jgi:copper(I)-binding protein
MGPTFTAGSSAEQEASVNRIRTRILAMTAGLSAGASTMTAGLAAGGLAAAMTMAGCSAGQVAQTAVQQPAVNGTGATVGNIDLRNIHLRAPQTSAYIQPGADVELLFVAVNGSAEDSDRLVSITSDVGSIALVGDTRVPPGGTLVVGTPDLQPSPLDATEAAGTAEAAVALTKPISNGLTYGFTFKFQNAGEKKVEVPISAGEGPRREDNAENN